MMVKKVGIQEDRTALDPGRIREGAAAVDPEVDVVRTPREEDVINHAQGVAPDHTQGVAQDHAQGEVDQTPTEEVILILDEAEAVHVPEAVEDLDIPRENILVPLAEDIVMYVRFVHFNNEVNVSFHL